MKSAITIAVSALVGAGVATAIMYKLLADEQKLRADIQHNLTVSVEAVRMNWDSCDEKRRADGRQMADLAICVFNARALTAAHDCLRDASPIGSMTFGAPQ